MGLPRRLRQQESATTVRFPGDFARTLELYGRWQFDPKGRASTRRTSARGNFEYEMWLVADPDRDAFTEAVPPVALSSGGWAVYAGEREVMNQVGSYPQV